MASPRMSGVELRSLFVNGDNWKETLELAGANAISVFSRKVWYHTWLRTDGWQDCRDTVRTRQHAICEWCRTPCWSWGQSHHVSYDRWDDPDLQAWLCRPCHEARHGGNLIPALTELRRRVKEMGLTRAPAPEPETMLSWDELEAKLKLLGVT